MLMLPLDEIGQVGVVLKWESSAVIVFCGLHRQRQQTFVKVDLTPLQPKNLSASPAGR